MIFFACLVASVDPGMGTKRGIFENFNARKQDRRNSTTAKHYECRYRSTQTQVVPGRSISRAQYGKINKFNIAGAIRSLASMSLHITITPTQKAIDALKWNYPHAQTRKQ